MGPDLVRVRVGKVSCVSGTEHGMSVPSGLIDNGVCSCTAVG